MFPKCGVSSGNGVGFTFRNRSRADRLELPSQTFYWPGASILKQRSFAFSEDQEIVWFRSASPERENCMLFLEETGIVNNQGFFI